MSELSKVAQKIIRTNALKFKRNLVEMERDFIMQEAAEITLLAMSTEDEDALKVIRTRIEEIRKRMAKLNDVVKTISAEVEEKISQHKIDKLMRDINKN